MFKKGWGCRCVTFSVLPKQDLKEGVGGRGAGSEIGEKNLREENKGGEIGR